ASTICPYTTLFRSGEVPNNVPLPQKDGVGGKRPRRALHLVAVDRNCLSDAQRRGVKGEARLIHHWVRDVEHGSARDVDGRRSVFREQAVVFWVCFNDEHFELRRVPGRITVNRRRQ